MRAKTRTRSRKMVTDTSLPPFERLGAWVHARRTWVIGAWLLLIACALPFAPQAPGALQAGGFDLPTLESARAR
ncbi:MAG: hypothetical protein ACKO8K_05030, partial [Candidatus Limnocylindrus sp.]